MGHTGIKPDVERIGHLFVSISFIAQDVRNIKIKPGIDALFLDAQGHLFDKVDRIGMQ